MDECEKHAGHTHHHGPNCGHTAVSHNGHVDYLNDGHLHHVHGDHVDEHVFEVNATNPEACTGDHECAGHEVGHVHSADCGHERVPHGDHVDYLVEGHLHHPHGAHCDDHGPLQVEEDYGERAKRELMHTTWIDLYFAMAFSPFETTQKVAELMWEAHGRQQKDASAYWHEAENKVWGPNRQLIRKVAYFMWDMAGKQPDMATSFWVAAQKYVASLMALATKLRTSPDNLMSVFSPAAYFHRVQDLAQTMWRRAGGQAMMPPLTFWLSAENHILTMLAGVATAVQTLQDAAQHLHKISDFSDEKYLRHIGEDAYYRWEMAGKPFGEALAHWIESEEKILARVREMIGSSPFDQFSSSD